MSKNDFIRDSWIKIISFLNDKDKSRLRQVCKLLKVLCDLSDIIFEFNIYQILEFKDCNSLYIHFNILNNFLTLKDNYQKPKFEQYFFLINDLNQTLDFKIILIDLNQFNNLKILEINLEKRIPVKNTNYKILTGGGKIIFPKSLQHLIIPRSDYLDQWLSNLGDFDFLDKLTVDYFENHLSLTNFPKILNILEIKKGCFNIGFKLLNIKKIICKDVLLSELPYSLEELIADNLIEDLYFNDKDCHLNKLKKIILKNQENKILFLPKSVIYLVIKCSKYQATYLKENNIIFTKEHYIIYHEEFKKKFNILYSPHKTINKFHDLNFINNLPHLQYLSLEKCFKKYLKKLDVVNYSPCFCMIQFN